MKLTKLVRSIVKRFRNNNVEQPTPEEPNIEDLYEAIDIIFNGEVIGYRHEETNTHKYSNRLINV